MRSEKDYQQYCYECGRQSYGIPLATEERRRNICSSCWDKKGCIDCGEKGSYWLELKGKPLCYYCHGKRAEQDPEIMKVFRYYSTRPMETYIRGKFINVKRENPPIRDTRLIADIDYTPSTEMDDDSIPELVDPEDFSRI